MNRYDIEHVQKMLNPLFDTLRGSSDKTKKLSDEIDILSKKFKKLEHDLNNAKMVIYAYKDITKMNLDELTNRINLITKKEL